MKRFLLGMAVVGFAAAPLACDNPFDTDQSVRLGVTQLDAPNTISTGGSLTVTLTVQTGGCLRFDHFEIQLLLAVSDGKGVGHSICRWAR